MLSIYCPDPEQAVPRDVAIHWLCDGDGLFCPEFLSLDLYPLASRKAIAAGWKLATEHLCQNCSGK